jgi:hypothetical protein
VRAGVVMRRCDVLPRGNVTRHGVCAHEVHEVPGATGGRRLDRGLRKERNGTDDGKPISTSHVCRQCVSSTQ